MSKQIPAERSIKFMDMTSRRTFLKWAALAAPSAASFGSVAAWGITLGTPPGKPPQAWRTSEKVRCEQIEAPQWRDGAATGPGAIQLEPAQQFQELLGFGAALTDASCYLLEQMPAAARGSLLKECFGADGLRLSIGRTTIGSSDYSRNAYTYDDTSQPDPDLQHFSLEHDRQYILPVLRETQQVNPEIFYFSSPWSPPAWMKAGNSLLGGSMRSRYFGPYADYFVKFLEGYAADGVHIRAVTIQNEIDTDQGGRMPQCMWGQEYEIQFVKEFLGPALQKNSLDTKIWILDHNYNLWGRVADEFEDPDLSKYVDGVAWHGYFGPPAAMKRVHNMFPLKNAYWTEGGSDFTLPDYTTDWAKWSGTFAGILNNWARSIVTWNLVLDEQGKPNIGPFSCGGVLTLNSQTQQLTRSGLYWALAHYSRFMQRGARVFATQGDLPDVDHVAAQNPDGSRVLVLTNRGNGRQVQCTLANKSLQVDLPANSVTTLVL
jgi:glucosylceramidase